MDKLNLLYEKALEVKFDEHDNIVFISDMHRGDGTYYDSLLPNINIYRSALFYYYRRNFTYVEVGDGDELWKNKNFNDIAYSYDHVFSILNKFKQENRIYMIYGNHDIIKRNKSFYKNQCKSLKKVGFGYCQTFLNFVKGLTFHEAINFKYVPIDEKILVTHGHQVDIMNYNYWRVSRFLVRYIWKFLNGVAGFKDPTSPARNNLKGSKVDKGLETWSKENSKMLLCGHTHNSRMPSIEEAAYFNDGCCILPYAMTAIEIEKGKISLVKWSVESEESGVLWVKREVIGGPESLSQYLLRTKNLRIKLEKERNKL